MATRENFPDKEKLTKQKMLNTNDNTMKTVAHILYIIPISTIAVSNPIVLTISILAMISFFIIAAKSGSTFNKLIDFKANHEALITALLCVVFILRIFNYPSWLMICNCLMAVGLNALITYGILKGKKMKA